MSVEDAKVVDAIGVEIDSGKIILTVADPLDWTDEVGHESKLQSKLNTYLAFIESEELLTAYPDAKGRVPVIDVVLRVQPSARGHTFFARVRDALDGTGIELRVRVFPD